jgi:hypothetical protein
MTAKKPADLIVKHEVKEEKRRRAERAKMLTPRRALSIAAPRKLTGKVAQAYWRETIRLYMTIDARIVTVLDRGLLVDYCLACEQLQEMDEIRKTAVADYKRNPAAGNLDDVLRLDARVDAKRKLVHTLRQSLMLTPRSRSGVGPADKQPEEAPSEMALIIDGKTKPEKD